jgi:uncharacterized protein (DUF983 family)
VSRLAALLRQRCPLCREGRVFKGIASMNERCPVCDVHFSREPGYFVGAMYVAFGLSLPPYLAILYLLYRVTTWRLEMLLGAAAVAMLPVVPIIFRDSRVAWIHLDRYVDPERGR